MRILFINLPQKMLIIDFSFILKPMNGSLRKKTKNNSTSCLIFFSNFIRKLIKNSIIKIWYNYSGRLFVWTIFDKRYDFYIVNKKKMHWHPSDRKLTHFFKILNFLYESFFSAGQQMLKMTDFLKWWIEMK